MKRLCILLTVCLVATFSLADQGRAALVNVNFTGAITAVNDDGGLPGGNTITAGVSTFTGQFNYDTSTPIWLPGPPARYYRPTGFLSIVIDGTYNFQADTSIVYLFERTPGTGNDELKVLDNYNANFPVGFPLPGTTAITLQFLDSDATVLSTLDLPTSFNLADWESRTLRLDGLDWRIDGQINVVPIPGAVWLLGSGLIGIVGFRRKFKK